MGLTRPLHSPVCVPGMLHNGISPAGHLSAPAQEPGLPNSEDPMQLKSISTDALLSISCQVCGIKASGYAV